MNELAKKPATDAIETALLGGDLSKLTTEERGNYYNAVCTSLQLNPLTRPFEYITLNGKLTRHYYAVREAAQVPLIRLHDHRHTCATLLLAQGCTLNEVKQVLGHSQIGITANIYGHWAEQIADDAARAAERGLFGA